jgi:hypothetical protein
MAEENNEEYFMFDEKYWDKLNEEDKNMVIDTLISLSSLSNCERLFWIHTEKNSEKSIVENLKFIGIHAGEKRMGMGEFMLPSSFYAILQYEFMLDFLKELKLQPPIKTAVDYGLRIVERFRNHFNLSKFEREDDVLIIEVFEKEGENGYVDDFNNADYIGEKFFVRRCMPSKPSSIGLKITKSFGFINTTGDITKSSKRIREIFGVRE